MEEREYKSSYNELASVRCVFEKALTNNKAKCALSRHFCLADREGYACQNATSSEKCRYLLELLRKKSIFALKLREAEGPLPHNMEMRVQVGGISGLAKSVTETIDEQVLASDIAHSAHLPSVQVVVDDIQAVIEQAVKKFGSLDQLPYSQIVQSVVQFQGRRRRQR